MQWPDVSSPLPAGLLTFPVDVKVAGSQATCTPLYASAFALQASATVDGCPLTIDGIVGVCVAPTRLRFSHLLSQTSPRPRCDVLGRVPRGMLDRTVTVTLHTRCSTSACFKLQCNASQSARFVATLSLPVPATYRVSLDYAGIPVGDSPLEGLMIATGEPAVARCAVEWPSTSTIVASSGAISLMMTMV